MAEESASGGYVKLRDGLGGCTNWREVFWESVPKSWCSVGKWAVAELQRGWDWRARQGKIWWWASLLLCRPSVHTFGIVALYQIMFSRNQAWVVVGHDPQTSRSEILSYPVVNYNMIQEHFPKGLYHIFIFLRSNHFSKIWKNDICLLLDNRLFWGRLFSEVDTLKPVLCATARLLNFVGNTTPLVFKPDWRPCYA